MAGSLAAGLTEETAAPVAAPASAAPAATSAEGVAVGAGETEPSEPAAGETAAAESAAAGAGETQEEQEQTQPVKIYITDKLLNKIEPLTDDDIKSLNEIPDGGQHHRYLGVIYNTGEFEQVPDGYNEKNYIRHENTSTGTKFYMYFKEVNQERGGTTARVGSTAQEYRGSRSWGMADWYRNLPPEVDPALSSLVGGKRKTPKRRKQRRGKRATSKAKRRK